ncbi:hypothetical protein V1505DRAFT_423599 [Lipomyces doorenjongii]
MCDTANAILMSRTVGGVFALGSEWLVLYTTKVLKSEIDNLHKNTPTEAERTNGPGDLLLDEVTNYKSRKGWNAVLDSVVNGKDDGHVSKMTRAVAQGENLSTQLTLQGSGGSALQALMKHGQNLKIGDTSEAISQSVSTWRRRICALLAISTTESRIDLRSINPVPCYIQQLKRTVARHKHETSSVLSCGKLSYTNATFQYFPFDNKRSSTDFSFSLQRLLANADAVLDLYNLDDFNPRFHSNR